MHQPIVQYFTMECEIVSLTAYSRKVFGAISDLGQRLDLRYHLRSPVFGSAASIAGFPRNRVLLPWRNPATLLWPFRRGLRPQPRMGQPNRRQISIEAQQTETMASIDIPQRRFQTRRPSSASKRSERQLLQRAAPVPSAPHFRLQCLQTNTPMMKPQISSRLNERGGRMNMSFFVLCAGEKSLTAADALLLLTGFLRLAATLPARRSRPW